MKMTRIAAIALSFTLAVSVFPAPSYAADAAEEMAITAEESPEAAVFEEEAERIPESKQNTEETVYNSETEVITAETKDIRTDETDGRAETETVSETAAQKESSRESEESGELSMDEGPAVTYRRQRSDIRKKSSDSAVTWTDNTRPHAISDIGPEAIRSSYLAPHGNGYLRVASAGSNIVIEYYDKDLRMTKQGLLPMELELWGGFFSSGDAYYIAEGQDNGKCVDGTEVLRIIKYDLNWKRLGSGSVYAKEGWEYEIRYPFNFSNMNMTENGGKLYLATGREGYVDPEVHQGHQGMMLIRMDEYTFKTEIIYGDFSHSFAQYLSFVGNDLYIGELSEGHRCTCLSVYDTNKKASDSYNVFSSSFPVLKYGGTHTSAWSIPCYATVDDMAASSDTVLIAGTSIDQSLYDNADNDTPFNIYLTVTPVSDPGQESTNIRWLTDYSKSKAFTGVTITKINNNRFLVIWGENERSKKPEDMQDTLSFFKFHYLFVDRNGNKVSRESTYTGSISDCKPIVKGDKVVFYASDGSVVDFYSIDAQSGSVSKKVYRFAGDNATWDYKNGVLSISGKGEVIPADSGWDNIQKSVKTVRIGEGITSLPALSFAFLRYVKTIEMPSSLKNIEKPIFDKWHKGKYTIKAGCKSYAIKFAKKNKISYKMVHNFKNRVCTECGKKESAKKLKAQSLTVKAGKISVKYARVKKEAQAVKRSKAFKIKKAKGTLTFKKKSGSGNLSVDRDSGVITVKKGTKKGTYKIKVRVSAAGNAKYKQASKTVTVKVKVR